MNGWALFAALIAGAGAAAFWSFEFIWAAEVAGLVSLCALVAGALGVGAREDWTSDKPKSLRPPIITKSGSFRIRSRKQSGKTRIRLQMTGAGRHSISSSILFPNNPRRASDTKPEALTTHVSTGFNLGTRAAMIAEAAPLAPDKNKLSEVAKDDNVRTRWVDLGDQ